MNVLKIDEDLVCKLASAYDIQYRRSASYTHQQSILTEVQLKLLQYYPVTFEALKESCIEELRQCILSIRSTCKKEKFALSFHKKKHHHLNEKELIKLINDIHDAMSVHDLSTRVDEYTVAIEPMKSTL